VIAIETERLRIDPLGVDDAAAFAAYRAVPEVARYQSWGEGFSLDDARRILDGQPDELPDTGDWLQLAVRERSSGVLLGDVAVHRDEQPGTWELGVTLAPGSQGRGVAAEALRAVIDLLFDRDAHRVWAQCDQRNAAVQRLLARVGFRHEATLRDADWFKEEWTTVEIFALLASDRTAS